MPSRGIHVEAIPHDRLMAAIEERVVDRHILKLLRALLRAGVMEEAAVRRSVTGTPQGGVISPLLCNVYLHRLDRQWATRGRGVLVRYADDLIVMCQTRQREAEAALAALRQILGELGFQLKEAKTRIVQLAERGEGVDFLGFHHRWVRARRARHVCFLARWPSRRGMQHARDQLRDMTDRRWLLRPVDETVQKVNTFLRGWAGYFRYGNSARHFDAISDYAARRVALLLAKRHRRSRGYGWSVLAFQSPDRLALIDLNHRRATTASVVARVTRMPAVKNVGEPCAGEPHARFEAAAGGNQRQSATPRSARRLPPTRHQARGE